MESTRPDTKAEIGAETVVVDSAAAAIAIIAPAAETEIEMEVEMSVISFESVLTPLGALGFGP
jgi:hypothetical protein